MGRSPTIGISVIQSPIEMMLFLIPYQQGESDRWHKIIERKQS